jgi:large subunit ribosomal protein L29
MSENIMDAVALRALSIEELEQHRVDFKQELFNLRFQHHTGQLENFKRIKHVKRNIARIKTIQNERELENLES